MYTSKSHYYLLSKSTHFGQSICSFKFINWIWCFLLRMQPLSAITTLYLIFPNDGGSSSSSSRWTAYKHCFVQEYIFDLWFIHDVRFIGSTVFIIIVSVGCKQHARGAKSGFYMVKQKLRAILPGVYLWDRYGWRYITKRTNSNLGTLFKYRLHYLIKINLIDVDNSYMLTNYY